jgi:hypothetical protein
MGVCHAGQSTSISRHQQWLGSPPLFSIPLLPLLILAQQSPQWYLVLEFVMWWRAS